MSEKSQNGFFSFLNKKPTTTTKDQEESFFYEQIAAMVGAGSWRIDFINKKSFIDDQMRNILETPENYTPSLKHTLHFFDMEYHDVVVNSFNQLSSGTPSFDKVIKMVTYTNKTFWAHAISKPIQDKKGKVIGLRGVVVNVDKEK
ncbi:MAG: hypothetical protein VX319_00565 [Bacteroidota bacterium]|nr:hypothetical protein [Bacteroidota bacterium]